MPATGRLSLIAIGTPANGRGSPGSMSSAAESADSAPTCVKALICGSSAAIASSESCTSSVALSAPERTIDASFDGALNISSDIALSFP
jgi:hypothetical protein